MPPDKDSPITVPSRRAQPAQPKQFSITSISFGARLHAALDFLLRTRGDCEFCFIGVHHPSDPSHLIDYRIPKQTVRGTHYEPDLDSFIDTLESIPPECRRIVHWWHTHPPGVTSPSGTDWDTLAHLTSISRPTCMGILVNDPARTTYANIRTALSLNPSALDSATNDIFVLDTRYPVEFPLKDLSSDPFYTSPTVIDYPALLAAFDALVTRAPTTHWSATADRAPTTTLDTTGLNPSPDSSDLDAPNWKSSFDLWEEADSIARAFLTAPSHSEDFDRARRLFRAIDDHLILEYIEETISDALDDLPSDLHPNHVRSIVELLIPWSGDPLTNKVASKRDQIITWLLNALPAGSTSDAPLPD